MMRFAGINSISLLVAGSKCTAPQSYYSSTGFVKSAMLGPMAAEKAAPAAKAKPKSTGKPTFQEADPAEPLFRKFASVFGDCEHCTIERKQKKDWIEVGTIHVDGDGIVVAAEILRVVDEHAESEGAGKYRWRMYGKKRRAGKVTEEGAILAGGELTGGDESELEEEQPGTVGSILREATKLMSSHNTISETAQKRSEEHVGALYDRVMSSFEAMGTLMSANLTMAKGQRELAVEETRLKLETKKLEIEQQDRRDQAERDAARDQQMFGMLQQLGSTVSTSVLPTLLPAVILKIRIDAAIKAKNAGLNFEDFDDQSQAQAQAQAQPGVRVTQEEAPKPGGSASQPMQSPLRVRVKAALDDVRKAGHEQSAKTIMGAKLYNVLDKLSTASDDEDEGSVCDRLCKLSDELGREKFQAMGLKMLALIGPVQAQKIAALFEEIAVVGNAYQQAKAAKARA
jgi:hypothetical protein